MTSKMDTGLQGIFRGNGCKENYNENTIGNKGCTNSGFNYGNSSKLAYDGACIKDSIQQSTAPIQSTMDPNRIRNCKQCLSTNGPRASYMGWAGDSLPIESAGVSPFNQVIDVDSIMTNRNVKQERTKKGKVNPVDINKFKLYDSPECNNFLDPLNTTLTVPKQLYREMSINRFYNHNLPNDKPIFWDFAVNSRLQASDNFDNPYPYSVAGNVEPNAIPTNPQQQKSPYASNGVPVLMTNLTINSAQTPLPVTNGFQFYTRKNMNSTGFFNDSESESGDSTDNEQA